MSGGAHYANNCALVTNSSDFSELVGMFRAYVSPVIAIAGITGNLLIIATFAREQPRTRFSVFAISLAIAHTVSLIVNTIIDDFFGRGLAYATDGRFFLKFDATSEAACKLLEFLPRMMYFVASYLVVVFSIDRTLAVYNPIKYHACRYQRQAIIACLVVVFIGAIGNTPTLVVQTLERQEGGCTACRMVHNETILKDFFIVSTTLVTFFIPVIAVFALNVVIVLRLWRAHQWRQTAGVSGGAQEVGRITGHLAMTTCFLLLYIPLGFVVLVRLHYTLHHSEDYTPRATQVINLSKFFSSLKDIAYAVNCFIYAAFLGNFRARLVRLCKG
ncbi:unnamed protein product [Mesocestoides corti]|uniref:G-protein coupled receptors family 1 profile domain-containing protein n=1 Tax=Mesocestoides corti TaxID=53468 RepID=A0A0R3U5C5_MESCO|nr:unnamed protein product [Mesocestoides corti]